MTEDMTEILDPRIRNLHSGIEKECREGRDMIKGEERHYWYRGNLRAVASESRNF